MKRKSQEERHAAIRAATKQARAKYLKRQPFATKATVTLDGKVVGTGVGVVIEDCQFRVNPPVPVFMSTDSAVRKLMPVASGCLNYFPDALLCVSFISRVGNDKHNPGQPLHWAKEKSTDEADCEVRHMLDFLRGEAADPGLEPLGELGHLASKAWRALAHLQRACDDARKASGR